MCKKKKRCNFADLINGKKKKPLYTNRKGAEKQNRKTLTVTFRTQPHLKALSRKAIEITGRDVPKEKQKKNKKKK